MLFGFAITWASLFNQMHCVGDRLARCVSIGIFESPSLGHCNDFGSYFFFFTFVACHYADTSSAIEKFSEGQGNVI